MVEIQTEFIEIIGYRDPAVLGNTTTFICRSLFKSALVGPDSSTCMGNGKWEPDPREVELRR